MPPPKDQSRRKAALEKVSAWKRANPEKVRQQKKRKKHREKDLPKKRNYASTHCEQARGWPKCLRCQPGIEFTKTALRIIRVVLGFQ